MKKSAPRSWSIGGGIVILITIFFTVYGPQEKSPPQPHSTAPSSPAAKKKILVINAYHAEYPWSAGIIRGIRSTLAKAPSIQCQIFSMDTKRNHTEAFIKSAAQRANEVLHAWQPDLVIACDDNAIQYVVKPLINDTDLPVVFCGANWHIHQYALATNRNVTGMIEIAHYQQLLAALSPFAAGTKVGYLAGENPSTTTEFKALQQECPQHDCTLYAVCTFAEWKTVIAHASDQVDLLLINNNGGIANWNATMAKEWVTTHLSIPTGSSNEWMSDVNMMTFAKYPEEQGEWAAQTALNILAGTPPNTIPVATSKKAKIFLNMNMANQLGIKLPIELIQNAHLISPP